MLKSTNVGLIIISLLRFLIAFKIANKNYTCNYVFYLMGLTLIFESVVLAWYVAVIDIKLSVKLMLTFEVISLV